MPLRIASEDDRSQGRAHVTIKIAPKKCETRLFGAAMRTCACLLAINLLACQANESTSTRDNVRAVARPPGKAMPFGLTCDQCMYGHVQDCGWAADAPVVAVVSGSREQDVHRRCLAEPGPESPAVCLVDRQYRFASARFLRNELGAGEKDSFEALTTYDEVVTNDIERHAARGVALESGVRYAIFAVADRKDIGHSADWYINIACALHGSEEPGAIP